VEKKLKVLELNSALNVKNVDIQKVVEMVHKIQKEEQKGNIFQEGIAGWKMLFGLFGKKKEQPQQQPQQQQPQQNQPENNV
jgi:hypothetical protein